MLTSLFNDLKRVLSSNTPNREPEKAMFIEKRMVNLTKQNLTESELNTKINNYLSYSTQGVMNALAFNKNISSDITRNTVSAIVDNLNLHNFLSDSIYYTNANHDGIKAYYNESQQPKIAIILTGNDYTKAQILPFVDRDELQQIIKTRAIEDSFYQFKGNQMDAEQLVANLMQLSSNKDDAFNKILSGTGYDLSTVQTAVTAQFDIEVQMDKALKTNTGKINQSEMTMIQYLDQTAKLESYQFSRINKHSVLSDTAQQRLMLAIDEYHTNKRVINIEQPQDDPVKSLDINQPEENNEISSPRGIRIGDLAKEHETLFKKIQIGDTHYWENTEKTVKIHPEKISVPKVSRDSVELALSAAISNFGNTISVRGTEEFIGQVLKTLSENEKYKKVNLSNEDLQAKLDELRGVKPLANEITASPENKITAPENNTLQTKDQISTSEPVIDITSDQIEPIDSQQSSDSNQTTNQTINKLVTNPPELIIYDLVHQQKVASVENNTGVINYFLKQFHGAPADEIQAEINSGYILDKSRTPTTKIDITIENPSYLANIFTSRINLSRFGTQDYDQHFLCGPIDRINELDKLLQQRSKVRTEDDLSPDYKTNLKILLNELSGTCSETPQSKLPTQQSPALTTGNPDDLTSMIVERDTFPGLTSTYFAEALKYYNINQKDSYGQTALITAAIYGMPEEAKALLSAGAQVNLIDTDSRASALAYALTATSHRMELSELLLQHGADPNLIPSTHCSPLISVIAHEADFKEATIEPLNDKQRISLVEQLLARGADPNFQDDKGRTALHFASQEEHPDIIEVLLEYGANPLLIDHEGNTPMHYIHPSSPKAEQMVDMLVGKGLDPFAINKAGEISQFTQACQISEQITNQNTVGTEAIMTNEAVLKHYEKISPDLVNQVRRDGGIDVPGAGGGQWSLKDEDPSYLTQLLTKATGHSIDTGIAQSQDQVELNSQRKI